MRYKDLIDNFGYNNFYKGMQISSADSQYLAFKIINGIYFNYFSIYDTFKRKKFEVTVNNNGKKIFSYTCNCENFKKTHSCEHLVVIFRDYYDEIIENEVIDELAASRSILKYFQSNTENHILEKLNISLKFNFADYRNHVWLKLLVGNEKQYTLSKKGKIVEFLNAIIGKSEYNLGKFLSYNPNKHYFDNEGKNIINFILETLRYGEYNNSSDFLLSYREFDSLINSLKETKMYVETYSFTNKIKEIKIGFPTEYLLNKIDDHYELIINDFENYIFLGDAIKYVYYKGTLYILNREEATIIALLGENKINKITFEKKDIKDFNDGLLKKIKSNLIIDSKIDEITLPTKPNIKLYFDFSYSKLKCDVVFDYNGKEVNYYEKSDISRDEETERNCISKVVEYGFIEENNKFLIEDVDSIYYFIENILPNIPDEYQVYTSKKIDETKILKKVSTNNNFSIGTDGIMSYNFKVNGIEDDELNNLFASLKSHKKYFKLKNSNVISLEDNESLHEFSNILNELNISNIDLSEGSVEIPKYRALYIDSLKQNKYTSIKTNNLFDEFINNFKKYKNIDINLSESDENILRDYQKDGIKWLTSLYKCDLGGILADEMGLGKSIQTIMFIKQVLQEKPEAKIIIVVPTSLIYNWQKEFEKFGSELKYVVVAENKEKRMKVLAEIEKYNVFITSYGLIRNDKDEYENVNFEVAIIDEAQNIKNYQALMTREIKKIKAKCRIALTGTPIENNVMELWSIFDFIMPGYLNSIQKFKERYNIKDVNENDLKILQSLNYQIKPFILRRKKADVVLSLPEKIENNVYVDLPEIQKKLYLKVLNDTKKELDEISESGDFLKSRIKILQLLTRLRQICIDPNVVYDNYNGESVKLEELLKIVEESRLNGHKMLIFSSFKKALDNVKSVFEKKGITYYMIDGSVKSKERMNMVEKFNEDETDCFLITLKAGGTGLNLVGADTVIHLDIWWNPQVENQATDRAHRIGQKKNVSVIKLITKGTIEERIIELQEKKKILSENLIEGNSEEILSSLSEKDIRKLLEEGES